MKIAVPLSVLMGLLPWTQARLKVASTVLQQEAEMAVELGRKKKKETDWHAPVRLSFKVDHFKSFEEFGTEEFNKKIAMGAFNRAFEQVFEGMSSDWGFIDSLVQVPEPEDPNQLGRMNRNNHNKNNHNKKPTPPPPPPRINSWTVYYGNFSVDARCRLCPDDLLGRGKSGGESFSKFLNDQAKWDEVAKRFCTELKDTGIENFAEVKNCAFTVGYLGENAVELMESTAPAALESGEEADVSGSMKTIITAYRVHPSAVLDASVLEKAFAVAYNNVFEDRDYVVEGIQLLRQVTAPENAVGQTIVRVRGNEVAISMWDEDEDSSEDGDGESDDVDFLTAMYWVDVNWTCKGTKCNADDMLPGVFLQNMPDTSRHSILESYLCHNLREFGDAILGDVAGCDILFQGGM